MADWLWSNASDIFHGAVKNFNSNAEDEEGADSSSGSGSSAPNTGSDENNIGNINSNEHTTNYNYDNPFSQYLHAAPAGNNSGNDDVQDGQDGHGTGNSSSNDDPYNLNQLYSSSSGTPEDDSEESSEHEESSVSNSSLFQQTIPDEGDLGEVSVKSPNAKAMFNTQMSSLPPGFYSYHGRSPGLTRPMLNLNNLSAGYQTPNRMNNIFHSKSQQNLPNPTLYTVGGSSSSSSAVGDLNDSCDVHHDEAGMNLHNYNQAASQQQNILIEGSHNTMMLHHPTMVAHTQTPGGGTISSTRKHHHHQRHQNRHADSARVLPPPSPSAAQGSVTQGRQQSSLNTSMNSGTPNLAQMKQHMMSGHNVEGQHRTQMGTVTPGRPTAMTFNFGQQQQLQQQQQQQQSPYVINNNVPIFEHNPVPGSFGTQQQGGYGSRPTTPGRGMGSRTMQSSRSMGNLGYGRATSTPAGNGSNMVNFPSRVVGYPGQSQYNGNNVNSTRGAGSMWSNNQQSSMYIGNQQDDIVFVDGPGDVVDQQRANLVANANRGGGGNSPMGRLPGGPGANSMMQFQLTKPTFNLRTTPSMVSLHSMQSNNSSAVMTQPTRFTTLPLPPPKMTSNSNMYFELNYFLLESFNIEIENEKKISLNNLIKVPTHHP